MNFFFYLKLYGLAVPVFFIIDNIFEIVHVVSLLNKVYPNIC